LIAAGLALAVFVGLTFAGCYTGNPPAPCDPHCTDPAMVARDSGVDR